MKLYSTLIIPYHFDASQEESELSLTGLLTDWSQRTVPRVPKTIDETKIPDLDELRSTLHSECERLTLEGDPAQRKRKLKQIKRDTIARYPTTPAEINIVIDQTLSAFPELASEREKPLWVNLNSLRQALKTGDLDAKVWREIYQEIYQYTETKRMTNSGSGQFGLGVESTGEGLSTTLMNLWCLHERSEKTKTQATHKLKSPARSARTERGALNELSDQCLTLSANIKALKKLFPGLSFDVLKRGQHLKGMSFILRRALNILMPELINGFNGFCCLTFEVISQEEGQMLTTETIEDAIYQVTRLSGTQSTEYRMCLSDTEANLAQHTHLQLPNALKQASFTTTDLCHWLIARTAQESVAKKQVKRCGDLRKYFHHTSVISTEMPIHEGHIHKAEEFAWKLARSTTLKPPHRAQRTSCAFWPFYHRHISIAREGAVSIQYVSDLDQTDMWSIKRFQGIYLLFMVHTLGEAYALQDMAYEALKQIDQIGRSAEIGRAEDEDRLLELIRDANRIIYKMTKSHLSFNATASGHSEYGVFLRGSRNVRELPMLSRELEGSITSLNAVVEQMNHLIELQRSREEKRRAEDEKRRDEARMELERKLLDEEREHNKSTTEFERTLGTIGAIALPITVFSGFMGMNNFNPDWVASTSERSQKLIHILNLDNIIYLSLWAVLCTILFVFSATSRDRAKVIYRRVGWCALWLGLLGFIFGYIAQ